MRLTQVNHTGRSGIANLFKFALRSTFFQYDGLTYEQQVGTAMVILVSTVIENVYTVESEEKT